MHQEIARLIEDSRANKLQFQTTMDLIRRHYECQPGAFATGMGTARAVSNASGTNAASCCLLAFARRLGLDEGTTLGLYGEHYRAVLADPDGSDHGNIRAFMAAGWAGVSLPEGVLRLRGPA